LDAAEAGASIIVPSLWLLEVGNGLIVAERRARLKPDEIPRFLSLLKDLAIKLDQRSFAYTMETIVPMARKHKLTVYETAYLDLALREGIPLATIDKRLADTCKAAGGKLLCA
jgi:predicted nucleic acid-binding protein